MPDSPTTAIRRHPAVNAWCIWLISRVRPTKSVRQRREAAVRRGSTERLGAASGTAGADGSRWSLVAARDRSASSSGLRSRARPSCRRVDMRGARFRPRSRAAMAVGLIRA